MSIGRVISSCVAALAVAGCVTVVVEMGRAADRPVAAHSSPAPSPTQTPRPAYLPDSAQPGEPGSASNPQLGVAVGQLSTPGHGADGAVGSSAVGSSAAGSSAAGSSAAGSATVPPTPPSSPPPAPARNPGSAPVAAPPAVLPPVQPVIQPPAAPPAAAAQRGRALPLGYSTGNATRVITVTAGSQYRTTATLQAWNKAPGGGWLPWGPAITAHIGADGMTTHPSESLSATPIGSFTLTQAFGRDADPGTPLPYLRTTPNDWWISQTTGAAARLYNTHQRCASSCPFNRGDPNEHLYYETPYYDYAVVIDYNTRNAPGGVHLGAGSAFFLHVTDGTPTAGCVAIPQSRLIPIMRWLAPGAHPRILIGVT